jgi:hypothetical protein
VDARRSKVSAKILDKNGREVPRSDYDLDMTDFDFSFKFKKPGRGKSGKYTIVLANDAGETEKDIYVNFLGQFHLNFKSTLIIIILAFTVDISVLHKA